MTSRSRTAIGTTVSVVKDDRLQIRVNPAEKRLLELAADAAHLSVSAFVLAAAAQQAETLLAERQTMTLNPEAAAAFAESLARPAQVNKRLRALARPQKFLARLSFAVRSSSIPGATTAASSTAAT